MVTSTVIMPISNKAQIVSNWSHEDDNEFSVLQLVELNLVVQIWDGVEFEICSTNGQLTNL